MERPTGQGVQWGAKTEWLQLRQPNFQRLVRELRSHAVFDGRNIWDLAPGRELGLSYYGIGRA
jgi:UDPglucose 6-dehydrogenase